MHAEQPGQSLPLPFPISIIRCHPASAADYFQLPKRLGPFPRNESHRNAKLGTKSSRLGIVQVRLARVDVLGSEVPIDAFGEP